MEIAMVLALVLVVQLGAGGGGGGGAATQESSPCPPCHCVDGHLDCSQLSLFSERPLGIDTWNVSGYSSVSLDGSLQGFVPALPALPGVQELSLRHNGVSEIASAAFLLLTDLKVLDLSHNELTAEALRADVLRGPWRADSYEPLRVEVLDLSYNALHSLKRRALEHLPRLRELRLDGNPLGVLDHNTQSALSSATKLRVLSLSECRLRRVPADLLPGPPHGPTLRALDLSRNFLPDVPAGLPTTLHRLSLDGNPIRELPAVDSFAPPFLHLEELEELSVSQMPLLEHISTAAFFGLPSLRVLRCTDNPKLRDIHPTAFSHMGPSWTLTEVSLRNNSLRTLPPTLLAWRGLTFLDLAANPWHCSCNFSLWASDVLLKTNLNNKEECRCGSPENLAGRSLWTSWNASTPCSAYRRPAPMLAGYLLAVMTLLFLLLLALLLMHCMRPAPSRVGSMEHIYYDRAPDADIPDVALASAAAGVFWKHAAFAGGQADDR